MKTIRVVAVDGLWMLELDGAPHGQFDTKQDAVSEATRFADIVSKQGVGVRVLVPSVGQTYEMLVFSEPAPA